MGKCRLVPGRRSVFVDTPDKAPLPCHMEPAVIALLSVVGVLVLVLATVLLRRTPGAAAPSLETLQRGVEHVQRELSDLTRVLSVPRERGALGEVMLAELLRSWLPAGSYELQHGFSGGERVDAVVRLGKQLVCIDSKFPLEAVRRYLNAGADPREPLPGELRRTFAKHIEDIAARYIRPAEGTMGFALMYVPAEGVYHRVFAEHPEEVFRMALAKNVVPVSPSTLFLYLQTVAYGLRGMRLSERVQQIADELAELHRSMGTLGEAMRLSASHLRNLNRAFDDAGARFAEVERRAERLTHDD